MPADDPSANSRWILRRADQAAVGGLVLLALAAMAGWWTWQGGWQGRLVDLERLPRRTAQFQVDVNTAQWPELAQLPGVGEALARRIVASRDEDGPFADHGELRRVRGIGPRTLDQIKPYLRPLAETANVAGP